MNPARDLEYPFLLDPKDVASKDTVHGDIPKEHSLDKDDVIDPPEGVKPVRG
jgi:hypothetical protein